MYDASNLLPFCYDFEMHCAIPRGGVVTVDKGLLGNLINSACNVKIKTAFYQGLDCSDLTLKKE